MSTVHNYYENLVFSQIRKQTAQLNLILDQEQFEDAACLALNRLPPRYVRFDVDTTFYLSYDEMMDIERRVVAAVTEALAIVRQPS
ncbi:MAG: late competence development ComFB family protein [Gammaproteobacteria bacterium]|nr:late competence development ComFB family protein [Gammaproteobacteria bacterium]